ncbi:MAG TPA: hypothetical protein VFO67_11405 [Gemmatimonadales bacterium]|nr:hypothetical protein [Gemmatimonadales bacterium]
MQTLEQWLSVATRGLCDSAAERVRGEIGEHYASALESAGTADVDPLDAERRVLSALGDAKTANRQYRRVLLTEGEDVLLRGLMSRMRWVWVGIVALLSALALVFIPGNTPGYSYTKYFLTMVVIDAVLQAIPVGSSRAGWIVRTVRGGVLTIGMTMTLVSGLGDRRVYVSPAGAAIVFIIHSEYKLFVLRRKVPVERWPRRLWV